jgi:hypothetical protein
MRCVSDRHLDAAAIRLLDAGILAGRALGADLRVKEAALDRRTHGLLRHCRSCHTCRERLILLQETEIAVREKRAGSHAVASGAPVILRLYPIVSGDTTGEEGERFDMAAQTPDGSGREEHVMNTAVLTLTTDDERFLVRIFPNEGGGGATAVLLPGEDGGPASEPQERLRIRFAGRDYFFDKHHRAALPAFPASEIELLLD